VSWNLPKQRSSTKFFAHSLCFSVNLSPRNSSVFIIESNTRRPSSPVDHFVFSMEIGGAIARRASVKDDREVVVEEEKKFV